MKKAKDKVLKPLPKIMLGKLKKTTYYTGEVFVEDDAFYKKCCDQARKEITDEALFNWWLVTALEETVKAREAARINELR